MIIPAHPSANPKRSAEAWVVACVAGAVGCGAAWWFWRAGELLHYGDAMAHLNIARRLVDTRTPGMLQLGTVWLPLPHVLMAVFAADDTLWRTGLAGAIVGVASLALAAAAVYLLLRRVCGAVPSAVGAAVFAANPNALYLAATPMTEVLSLAAMLWAVYLALESRPVLGGFVATLAALTRYEAWILVPLLALVIGRRLGLAAALRFSFAAGVGPAWWLAHNWWFYGDALEFYRGEYSAQAIYARQLAAGVARYPAQGDWWNAVRYYGHAMSLTIGLPVLIVGGVGWLTRAKSERALLVLLAAAPVFIVWSLHSAGTQIYVPGLWPDTSFNTRYALAALPLAAVGAGLLAQRGRAYAVVIAAIAMVPWFEPSIVRVEGRALSVERRQWTAQAAPYLEANYRGGGIALSFGDLTGVLQQAGVPLRETLHDGNRPRFELALARPDLFLNEQWVLCFEGDPLSRAALRSGRYRLARRFNKAEFWSRSPSAPDLAGRR